MTLFRGLPTAKASFATKHVNRGLLDWDPRKRTRVRFSLMSERTAKLLDLRTSPIAERLAALDDFRAADYEVHVNLSPVVVHDGWLDDWRELLQALGDAVSSPTIRRCTRRTGSPARRTCCVAPQPAGDQTQRGRGTNVRYRRGLERRLLDELLALVDQHSPYLCVRYAL
nr:hypothetical protein [Saccharothrix sp.]